MRVLLINQSHNRSGGANSVCLNTGRILESYGHQVIYFAQKSPDNEQTIWSDYFYDGPSSRFQMVRCDFGNKKAYKQLELLLKHVKPDIAHIHELGNISTSIYKVLEKYGIPIVQTVHDYHFVCPVSHFLDKDGNSCELCKDGMFIRCTYCRCSKGRLLESIYATALFYYNRHYANPIKSFNGMIYVSNFSREKNLEHFPLLSKIENTVIYNSATPQAPSEYNNGYFLYFGRLSWEKGVDILVDAFIKLSHCQLNVVGSGPMEEMLRERAKNADNIVFFGFQKGKELQDQIKNASFVIVPSICYENNPMAIVEAYSYGKPVIGANSGAIPEFIENYRTGYLFDKGSVDSLCSIVETVTRISENNYSQMSKASYDFYSQHFTEGQYYESLIKFYDKVLDNDNE